MLWAAEEINTRAYVATGDFQHLQGKGYLEVPHPNPARLAAILAMPEIRSILPENIRASHPAGPVSPEHGSVDKFVHRMITHWYYWIMMGPGGQPSRCWCNAGWRAAGLNLRRRRRAR